MNSSVVCRNKAPSIHSAERCNRKAERDNTYMASTNNHSGVNRMLWTANMSSSNGYGRTTWYVQ